MGWTKNLRAENVKKIFIGIGAFLLGCIGFFLGRKSSGDDGSRNLDGIDGELETQREIAGREGDRLESERDSIGAERERLRTEDDLLDRDGELLAELKRRAEAKSE